MNGRKIVERIVVRADLVLTSPAHFGTGEVGDLTDMDIGRDALTGAPLLPGTSIAGALRAALLQRERGYRTPEQKGTAATLLFGGVKADAEGDQSPLIVDDAIASLTSTLVRDGVMLDAATRTAKDQAKYDIELVPSGTVFPLRFELLVYEQTDRAALLTAFVSALLMLAKGEIALGSKKTRGLGRCTVQHWRVVRYDLHQPIELIRYLRVQDADELAVPPVTDLGAALGVATSIPDQRQTVTLTCEAAVSGSLLVRGPVTAGAVADAMQLSESDQVLVPGSSIAGALRTRAERIQKVVQFDRQLIAKLFGPEQGQVGRGQEVAAARLTVADALITDSHPLVHNRVSIDRFTGGALDGALFNEQPAFGGTVKMTLLLRCDDQLPLGPSIGLLLLLLKDLWTGDLPLGGTISIGRGRLNGRSATLQTPTATWTLTDAPGLGLDATARAALQEFVDTLRTEVKA
jgi:CRISPR/Cas system CSM-associated protein Csm3 (group 7 of RAMP superfamily)